MPTWATTRRFERDFRSLSERSRQRFQTAVERFVEDLQANRPFRPGLRVRSIEGAAGVFEMTWAPDGRATFEFGEPVRAGEVHIIWRRVGDHSVFGRP